MNPDLFCLFSSVSQLMPEISLQCQPKHHIVQLRYHLHSGKIFKEVNNTITGNNNNESDKKDKKSLNEFTSYWKSDSPYPHP